MKKLFYSAIAVAGIFLGLCFKAQAQTWNIPTANGGTSTSFIGTTNSFDLPVFTNNLERMRITAAGRIGIGTTTPAANLHIHGLAGNYPVPAYAPIEMIKITASNITSTGTLRLGIDNSGNGFITGNANNYLILKSSKTIVHSDNLGGPGALPNNYYFGVTAGNSWFGGGVRIGYAAPGTESGNCMLGVDGAVRIGPPSVLTPAGYLLYVSGGILTEKVKVAVKTTTNWSDFVFDKSYNLMPLAEVEKFIDENKHLPDVPCAEEMVENGLDVATMDAKLLQKIEELTLYMIEMEKKMKTIEKENESLKKSIESIK